MSEPQPESNIAAERSPVIAYAMPTVAPIYAVVWCRILSLWMLAWGLEAATTFLGTFTNYLFADRGFGQTSSRTPWWLIADCLPAVTWLLIAWYFWRKAPALAGRMTRGLELGPTPSAMTPDQLLSIITMGIGIYLLSIGLSGVAQAAFIAFDNARTGQTAPMEIWENHTSSIARCILGLWLILGTHGVVALLRRHGGKWQDSSASSNPNDTNDRPD